FVGTMNFFEAEVVSRNSDSVVINAHAAGAVTLPATTCSAKTGSRVVLAVRPERISLATDGALKGRVSATNYLGAYTQLRVDVDGLAAPIAVSVQNTASGHETPRPGSQVALTWNPESFVILEP